MFLSKLFSNNRPITYLILMLSLFGMFSAKFLVDDHWSVNSSGFFYKLIYFVIVVLTMFLAQYILVKHKFNNNSLYALFIYSCFLLLFPSNADFINVMSSNFFVMLGLHQVLVFEQNPNRKNSIFDASIYFVIASFFYSWALAYFAVLYFCLLFRGAKDYRNWLIPIVALGILFCIGGTIYLYFPEIFEGYFSNGFLEYNLDYNYFKDDTQRIALSLYAGLAIQLLFFQSIIKQKIPQHLVFRYTIIWFYLIISILIYGFGNQKDNVLLAFTFFPMAIVATNIILYIKKDWFRELVLWLFLIICSVLFFLKL